MKIRFKRPTGLLTPLILGPMLLLVTACGGGDWTPEEQLDNNAVQSSGPAAKSPLPATKSPALRRQDVYLSAPPETDEIKDGFNPSLWNSHAWYDCNCGRNADAPSNAVPWTSSN